MAAPTNAAFVKKVLPTRSRPHMAVAPWRVAEEKRVSRIAQDENVKTR
jgi:hypothetical protein